MSTFDVEEVKSLATRGNATHNQVYMAHFDENRDQRPNPNVPDKMRDFIKMKYVEERWKAGTGGPPRRDSWGGSAGNGAPTSSAFGNSAFGNSGRNDFGSPCIHLHLKVTLWVQIY